LAPHGASQSAYRSYSVPNFHGNRPGHIGFRRLREVQ
jgi:hypothetical protein